MYEFASSLPSGFTILEGVVDVAGPRSPAVVYSIVGVESQGVIVAAGQSASITGRIVLADEGVHTLLSWPLDPSLSYPP